MNMFRKTTSEPVTEPHEGYDDPESPLFVPKPLRDAYAAASHPTPPQVSKLIEALATQQATDEGNARYVISDRLGREIYNFPPPEAYRAEIDQRAERIQDSDYDRLHTLAVHTLRLDMAKRERARQDKRAADRERSNAANTCPKCGQCDPGANGRVIARDLLGDAGPDARRTFVSCFPCFKVRQAQLAREWEHDRLEDGRTRGEAVRSHDATD